MDDAFYRAGLRFSCTRCSRCCRHAPGFVFLDRKDLLRLAGYLGLSPRQFYDSYCRQVDLYGISRISLREKSNYDCILWEAGGCSVYPARPFQCRSYPFWAANLVSEESWAAVGEECPGVGTGRRHARAEIERWLARAADHVLLSAPSELPVEH